MMNPAAARLWAETKLHIWPERYVVAGLDIELFQDALDGLREAGPFCTVLLERDEVSVTLSEDAWLKSPLPPRARAVGGPFRVVTLDQSVDLDVSGFLAPAAQRLADEGIAVIPHGAYLKEHWVFKEEDLAEAVCVLERFIAGCRRSHPETG